MTDWQRIWRTALGPRISPKALKVLFQALLRNDPRIIQGQTTIPSPTSMFRGEPLIGACCLCFCGWEGEGLRTVGEVEWYFWDLCRACEIETGEEAAAKHFLNWWDEAPREEAFALLAFEVARSLALKEETNDPGCSRGHDQEPVHFPVPALEAGQDPFTTTPPLRRGA
jgi:hypothetical protein